MNKFYALGLALLVSTSTYGMALADDPQTYAMDKLANAQAQLDQLKAQKLALSKLTKAVKQDLRAAKIRAKAERIQISADTSRQDAAVMIEQSGVAVDLPNLMAARQVQGGILEYENDTNSKSSKTTVGKAAKQKNESEVFFPGGDQGKKIESRYGTEEDIGYIK